MSPTAIANVLIEFSSICVISRFTSGLEFGVIAVTEGSMQINLDPSVNEHKCPVSTERIRVCLREADIGLLL